MQIFPVAFFPYERVLFELITEIDGPADEPLFKLPLYLSLKKTKTANKVVAYLRIIRAGSGELVLNHRVLCLLWRKCVDFITKSWLGMGIALESVKAPSGRFIKKVNIYND